MACKAFRAAFCSACFLESPAPRPSSRARICLTRPSAPAPAPSKKRTPTTKLPAGVGQGTAAHFPVAGIGASAGGLEALEQFFSRLPKESGIAFVVIQNNTSSCPDDPFLGIMVVADNAPTTTYWQSVPVMKNYTVTSAGSYTFYVNGRMTSGQDASDLFWYANLVAVFYPS